ncbi:hypothetical protein C1A_382 [Wolbachia endosymbiont of Culex quinquefasciatus JHB]|uniref:Jg24873 protein n=1 Tax=Pararge aegeria aegeria TaxID=348720 RepID=A0A8S4QGL4_9NEOP|nr:MULTISPECIES: hypothetical protein [unclassified Wolbachia]EEB56200.1 hypothetical protein C1A_382 [Wolbachia endosymbiont of Culex quinquefasciatus JHB]CAH2209378.1 jg24873 [Pararge aegeria aegeria]CAQ54916.1 hypothetical protein WP0808 [Wolbachia endosymbiont of Culex quinquefasciatus Pel]
MVQGGAVDTGNSEYLAQGIFEIIQGDKALQEEARKFLDQNEDLKNLDSIKKADIISLLENEKSEKFFTAVSKKLSGREKFKKLAEQVGKNLVMEEKLEALGNQLLVQGVISGAAFTTLTGALVGTLAIGGVAGALLGGGIALLGLLAIAAIAAIGYAIYQHRDEIKENADKSIGKVKKGAIKCGKAVKSFVKDVIDELTWEKINFSRLEKEFIDDMVYPENAEKSKEAQNKIRIIKMLKNEEQRSAIQELVKNGNIQNFSEADMIRLLEKGLSTHEEDMQKLLNLMEDFLPAIMDSGNNKIEKVEKIVGDKVKQMEPNSEVKNPSSERVSEERKGVN